MFLKGSMLCLAFSPAKREGWSAGFYPQRDCPSPPSEFPFLTKNQTQRERILPVETESLEGGLPSGSELPTPPHSFPFSPTEVAINAVLWLPLE